MTTRKAPETGPLTNEEIEILREAGLEFEVIRLPGTAYLYAPRWLFRLIYCADRPPAPNVRGVVGLMATKPGSFDAFRALAETLEEDRAGNEALDGYLRAIGAMP